jgi:nucleotide-binding universal stress UspA family protein
MATMNSVAVTFEHILVPTDFSEVSQRALEYAKTIARQGNSELLLVHVNPPINLLTPPETAWIDESEIQSQREEQLEQSGAALRSEGFRAQAISLTGPLYDELRSAIKQYKVDLIVMGTHGKKGLERLLIGSDAEAMLRQARCPVLSVGPAVPALQDKMWRIREVICATTLHPHSAEVAAFAHKVAAQHGAELVLFHVKNPDSEEDADWVSFGEAFHQHVSEDPGKISSLRTRLASAAPGVSIVDFAKQRGSDLIVMGARPASSMATHLPQGTAAKVLVEAPCPVMTLLQGKFLGASLRRQAAAQETSIEPLRQSQELRGAGTRFESQVPRVMVFQDGFYDYR